MLIYSKQIEIESENLCSENHANDGFYDLDSSLSLTSFPTKYPNLDFEFLKWINKYCNRPQLFQLMIF